MNHCPNVETLATVSKRYICAYRNKIATRPGTRPALTYFRQIMVLTMGSTLPRRVLDTPQVKQYLQL